mmetsp:Transcript_14172/g.21357  ORF Transcript_14172/g.21357 Transcript_14172/m.21357 type:complete len:297 (+) Transcript_14172:72-962(+)
MKYNDYYWDELPMEAKAAATNLGYTQELWDSNQESSCCKEEWDDLNKVQQDAATLLGYNQKMWDNMTMYCLNLRFSVLCFLLGSIFYFKLSFLDLVWMKYVRDHVPESLADEDDDKIWSQWAAEHNAADMLEVRDDYYEQYELFLKLGVTAFAVMGFSEVYRECSRANLILLMAGLAGMVGAHCSTDQIAAYWSCVSVHLFLMSCYKLDSKLFKAGCILECMLSYFLLAGYTGLWIAFADMIASLLWLYCALQEVSAVCEFSLKSFGKDGSSTHGEIFIEMMYSLINVSTFKMKRA